MIVFSLKPQIPSSLEKASLTWCSLIVSHLVFSSMFSLSLSLSLSLSVCVCVCVCVCVRERRERGGGSEGVFYVNVCECVCECVGWVRVSSV